MPTRRAWHLFAVWSVVGVIPPYLAVAQEDEPPTGCLSCHHGIEPIREAGSGMMQQIVALGSISGDPAGCVVCHGGDPTADQKDQAHRTPFYPDPGSPWINKWTCGQCHERHVATQMNSLMMSESGKIQGTVWSFGGLGRNYDHTWGNYDIQNPEDPAARVGTDDYRDYMEALKRKEPGAFPDSQEQLPPGVTELTVLYDKPELAVFTYIRSECQRCHLGVKGRDRRGDYRGMGCSACHIPYSNEGFYEGDDPTISKDEPGHMLVHSIQATREAKVTVHDKTYSGIPVETCTTCHDRGKRIGVSYQGLMESAFHSPDTEGGGGQIALHTKHYIALQADVHYQRGMLCGDCHTSIDVHGDGFIAGSNLGQIQIECPDCHGTPFAYPWELPLGYMDEFEEFPKDGAPRGVADALAPYLMQGTTYPKEDGYLRTARGNPFPEIVKRGNQVVLHSMSGKDFVLDPLKLKREQGTLGDEARVAMCQVTKHLERMECYACHATWVPQCYGCHLKIDFSPGQRSFDWTAAGEAHRRPGRQADRGEKGYDTYMPGHVSEQRSYMRWEDPALGVSGEGRVTPVTPGCQPSITLIGPKGDTIQLNHIYHTAPGLEGGGPDGQLAIDMSPGQPHTIGKARSCESCHASEKALGYGIAGGRLARPWDQPTPIDLMTADGRILPQQYRNQIEAIPGLENDWSRFVSEDGKQLMTVGHHWSGSRPLDNAERANMDRRGVCMSCHEEIPEQSVAVSLLHHTAKYAGALPTSPDEHRALLNKILLFSGWGQVGGTILFLAVLILAVMLWRQHRAMMMAAPAGEPPDRPTTDRDTADAERHWPTE